MDAQTGFDYVQRSGLMAGMRGAFPPEVALGVSGVLLEEGINVFEFLMNSERPIEAMQAVKREFGDDACVGMGTVLHEKAALQVIDAGADFIVSPAFNPDVVKAAQTAGILVAPGVLTPTECVDAWAMGVKLLKIFPIGEMGVGYLKALMGPLAHMKFLCNGGIDPATVRDFIGAGAVGCGSGGWLSGDGTWPLETIRARAKILRQTVDDVRSGKPETARV